eukprot:CAMPEP_0174267818 /NCGR_PEP_ID=MMETSP0439-20130205/35002_1 /TAXON_ID=0 /ORGANISM="Stereomyxa ramosa, Strain Chinc5" /LENGTH=358 /DNA_ID=CAMNT_0015355539 /DNA_START=103 /DNA_END=1176 /DNA_ORIENTATION=-
MTSDVRSIKSTETDETPRNRKKKKYDSETDHTEADLTPSIKTSEPHSDITATRLSTYHDEVEWIIEEPSPNDNEFSDSDLLTISDDDKSDNVDTNYLDPEGKTKKRKGKRRSVKTQDQPNLSTTQTPSLLEVPKGTPSLSSKQARAETRPSTLERTETGIFYGYMKSGLNKMEDNLEDSDVKMRLKKTRIDKHKFAQRPIQRKTKFQPNTSVDEIAKLESALSLRGETELEYRKRQNVERQESRQNLYGLDAELSATTESKLRESQVDKAIAWIEAVTGIKGVGEFPDNLKSGKLLCELMNCIAPGIIPKINERPIALYERENITKYLVACEKIGIRKEDLFTVSDLYEEKYLLAVIN